MRLIAAGRASEILDLGDGRVLRRFKDAGNPARKAAVMLAIWEGQSRRRPAPAEPAQDGGVSG
jgi:hypothetical protein